MFTIGQLVLINIGPDFYKNPFEYFLHVNIHAVRENQRVFYIGAKKLHAEFRVERDN